jgi:hypothetical protein
VVRGSFRRKNIAKIVSDTEEMKNKTIHVCAKTALLVYFQEKVGELILSTTSCPSIILLEHTVN